jgi:hypothetical protein
VLVIGNLLNFPQYASVFFEAASAAQGKPYVPVRAM